MIRKQLLFREDAALGDVVRAAAVRRLFHPLQRDGERADAPRRALEFPRQSARAAEPQRALFHGDPQGGIEHGEDAVNGRAEQQHAAEHEDREEREARPTRRRRCSPPLRYATTTSVQVIAFQKRAAAVMMSAWCPRVVAGLSTRQPGFVSSSSSCSTRRRRPAAFPLPLQDLRRFSTRNQADVPAAANKRQASDGDKRQPDQPEPDLRARRALEHRLLGILGIHEAGGLGAGWMFGDDPRLPVVGARGAAFEVEPRRRVALAAVFIAIRDLHAERVRVTAGYRLDLARQDAAGDQFPRARRRGQPERLQRHDPEHGHPGQQEEPEDQADEQNPPRDFSQARSRALRRQARAIHSGRKEEAPSPNSQGPNKLQKPRDKISNTRGGALFGPGPGPWLGTQASQNAARVWL